MPMPISWIDLSTAPRISSKSIWGREIKEHFGENVRGAKFGKWAHIKIKVFQKIGLKWRGLVFSFTLIRVGVHWRWGSWEFRPFGEEKERKKKKKTSAIKTAVRSLKCKGGKLTKVDGWRWDKSGGIYSTNTRQKEREGKNSAFSIQPATSNRSKPRRMNFMTEEATLTRNDFNMV